MDCLFDAWQNSRRNQDKKHYSNYSYILNHYDRCFLEHAWKLAFFYNVNLKQALW